ncbi:MAG TPA: diacylglycerol kinase family protein [Allosphingosinicella sp.]|nr:diacylglycerol kinase family protein [Allosphingosinicella sp.]
MKVRAIVNRAGGTLKGVEEEEQQIVAAFAAAGVDADVRMTDSADIYEALKAAAAAPGLDAVVAGGGDGTLSCAAGHLAGTGRAFGILPLGTLNHLARDAGIPTKLEEAAKVIAAGHVREIDVAEVNGRVFVNNSAVGLYPDMVMLRELEQEKLGRSKRRAMLSASLASLRSFRRHRLWISAPGLETPIRTPLLFIGNNRYQVNLFGLGKRERLDEGELCLYAIRAKSRLHLFWAGIRGIFGKLDQQRDFVTAYVTEAQISADRPSLVLSADGETVRMETPLNYRLRPKALRLLSPPPER